MSKKVILIDVDGVLVKWQSGLPYFNSDHNLPLDACLNMQIEENFIGPSEIFGLNIEIASKLMHKYNNSKYIRYLSGYPDALEFINKNKHKYDFVALTALSSDENAILNRLYNLNSLFPGAFVDVMSCDYMVSKQNMFINAKIKYGDNVVCFIDDLAKNLSDCYAIFDNKIAYYHMIRGPRDEHTIPRCEKIKSLNDIDLKSLDYNIRDFEDDVNDYDCDIGDI